MIAGDTTARVLKMDDLAPVLTSDFYASAGYYFDGVWSNVTKAEQVLMRILAERAKGAWTRDELADAANQPEEQIAEILKLLIRHDVIVDEVGGVRFASELMRRWVVEYQKKE